MGISSSITLGWKVIKGVSPLPVNELPIWSLCVILFGRRRLKSLVRSCRWPPVRGRVRFLRALPITLRGALLPPLGVSFENIAHRLVWLLRSDSVGIEVEEVLGSKPA